VTLGAYCVLLRSSSTCAPQSTVAPGLFLKSKSWHRGLLNALFRFWIPPAHTHTTTHGHGHLFPVTVGTRAQTHTCIASKSLVSPGSPSCVCRDVAFPVFLNQDPGPCLEIDTLGVGGLVKPPAAYQILHQVYKLQVKRAVSACLFKSGQDDQDPEEWSDVDNLR
jgi:hypothetical protein